MLARCAGFDSALIVRGVEGGVIPSLRATGRAFRYEEKGPEVSLEFGPAEFGVDQPILAPALPTTNPLDSTGPESGTAGMDTAAVAMAAARAGLGALAGEHGATRDSLVCGASLCLWHLGRYSSLQSAAQEVRLVLDSGLALVRLRCGS